MGDEIHQYGGGSGGYLPAVMLADEVRELTESIIADRLALGPVS